MPRWLRVSGLVPDFSITQTHATLVPNNEDGVNFCEPRSKMAAEFLGSARRSQVWAIQGQPCILKAGVPGGQAEAQERGWRRLKGRGHGAPAAREASVEFAWA